MDNLIYSESKNNSIRISLSDNFIIVFRNGNRYVFENNTYYLEIELLKYLNKIESNPDMKCVYIEKCKAFHPKLGVFLDSILNG